MNDTYDSERSTPSTSRSSTSPEPFYDGDGEFRIELPEDPVDRLDAIVVADER